MYSVLKIAALSYFLLSFSWLAYGQDVIKLTNGEWPPYMSEGYKHNGLVSHIVVEAFKNEGITVEYGFFPWKRAIKQAELGKEWKGSVGWSKNNEREAIFIYTDPIIELKDVFFHRKDLQFDWKTIDDLKNYKIGASVGYFYGKAFEDAEKSKKIKVSRTSKDENNLKKLAAGKIDLFPATLEVGYELIADKLPEGTKNVLTNHPRPVRTTNYHLIINKKIKDAQKYADAFNSGLKKLKESGKYEQMLSDSIEGKYRP
ncbi:substrate-binding periplasmic protein [Zooshikella harenae]|uniref:Transporter substrate-binding domain-containing protein n=1 Tax=Zooshikella harenae TaxID=2827238 RepID=A0ABS5ZBK3_9GAMM|nr:transporter substrate-binding domain-containing protein [Zooshikella harenae]MBU2711138.1 transporter substrate-binding domain-containing protein [Zooshikella harenae]